jgi:hypothetical protein
LHPKWDVVPETSCQLNGLCSPSPHCCFCFVSGAAPK